MANSREEEELLYEEEEVLWAKIRGYPWWPAFVLLASYRSIRCMLPCVVRSPNTLSSSLGTILSIVICY